MTKSLSDIRRIAAFAPNWLGDAVMCTPALRALQQRFPDAQMTLLGRAFLAPLYEGLPFVDEVVPIRVKAGVKDLLGLRNYFGDKRPDLAVLFPHSFRSALLARASGARRILGHDRNGRRLLLTHTVEPWRVDGKIEPIYMPKEYLDIVASVGAIDDSRGLELHAAPDEIEAVRAKLPKGAQVALLAAGAAFGPSKQWPADRFAAVADALSQKGIACILWTGPGEEETRDAVRRAAGSTLFDVTDGGPSIPRLKAAIASADVVICNDSGPRHVAIAFGKPVVCIMGPTSPKYTDSPWEKGQILRIEVDCGPCQKPVCATDHRCMSGVSVDSVVSAALVELQGKLLSRH